jgi:hypothetical protein
MSEDKEAKGVLALAHWPDGEVLATYSDFSFSGYGGYSLFEAQRMRARVFVMRAAIAALCHNDVAACMETYHVDALFSELVQKKGYAITIIPIGYDEKVERKARQK